MARTRNVVAVVGAVAAALVSTEALGQTRPAPDDVRAVRAVRFEPNLGQFDRSLRFGVRMPGGGVALNATAARVALGGGPSRRFAGWQLLGGAGDAVADVAGAAGPRVNYFIGADPSRWRRDVPTHARVTFRNVYPRIDVAYYGHDEGLEFDFLVAAGGDPRAIRLSFDADITLDASGDVLIGTGAAPLALRAPVAYQVRNGIRRDVQVRFARRSRREVGISVGAFDRRLPLVIDPVLAFSTFVGGSSSDSGLDVSVTAEGDVFVAGTTSSLDFPVTPGAFSTVRGASSEAFLARVSADGSSLIFATYLGGSGSDSAAGLALDATGVYVTGSTTSPDFPSLNALQPAYHATICTFLFFSQPCQDAYVAKLSLGGDALLYSTFFGGSHHDNGVGIDVDSLGQAHVLGLTSSSDLPLLNAVDSTYVQVGCGGEFTLRFCADAFVAKFSASGSALQYATYLGGDFDESAGNIRIDPEGRAVVAGGTNSFDFPIANAYQPVKAGGSCGVAPISSHFCFDMFVTRFQVNGALDFSTYFGGTGDDDANDVALAPDGGIWAAGDTTSRDAPLLHPLQSIIGGAPAGDPSCPEDSGSTVRICPDVFIVGFDGAGAELLMSTYLGGARRDEARGIAFDVVGRLALTGLTQSLDFPTSDAWQWAYGGGTCTQPVVVPCADVFVTVLDVAHATLSYSTYLGASGGDNGEAIAPAPDGGLVVVGTAAGGFPATAGAFRGTPGGTDAFITKLHAPPAARVLATFAGSGSSGPGALSGPALGTPLGAPMDVAVVGFAVRFVADAANHRIFRIDGANALSVFAGDGTPGSGGDFGPAGLAQLNGPTGVAVDAAGNVYIADSGNHRIRMVTTTGIIFTIAGTGSPGFSGDGGPSTAAQLNYPTGLLVTGDKLFVADTANHRVRMIVSDGTITTVAGNGLFGLSGDGGFSRFASLSLPTGLAVDGESGLLIADWAAHVVRRVGVDAIITTIAGTGEAGFGGDGGPAVVALLNGPFGVEVDESNRIFISDYHNNRIRMIRPGGTIVTLAGNGEAGAADPVSGPADGTPLWFPAGLAVDGLGNLLVTTPLQHRVALVHGAR